MPVNQRIYAYGKVLLSGEYAVLDGALALALPLSRGQAFTFSTKEDGNTSFTWRALREDGSRWIYLDYNRKETYASPVLKRFTQVLETVENLSPGFLTGKTVESKLDFDQAWGLGSSSTLTYALAKAAGIDPFLLNDKTFKSSGYDVACAGANGPLLYSLEEGQPKVDEIRWKPSFLPHLYLVHLGQKQNSRKAIKAYRQQEINKQDLVHSLSDITREMVKAKTGEQFADCMEAHEDILSKNLGLPTVKETHFAKHDITVKSLGAWGGDTALIYWPDNFTSLKKELSEWNPKQLIPLAQWML